MRGLAVIRAQHASIPPAQFNIGNFVPMRGHRDPIRTEADAWRAIWRDRQTRGIPVSFEEYQEIGAALTREIERTP